MISSETGSAYIEPGMCRRRASRAAQVCTMGVRVDVDQHIERLQHYPVRTVTCLVSARGSGGARFSASTDADEWRFCLPLAAWRIESGPLIMEPLVLYRYVSHGELRALMDRTPADAVVRLRARVDSTTGPGGCVGILAGDVESDCEDAEIEALLRRLLRPVRYEDARFGTFTLNRRVEWFEGRVSWGDAIVDVYLLTKHESELPVLFALLGRFANKSDIWRSLLNKCVIRELLDLKNDAWCEEDEPEITPEEFLQRITIRSISIRQDGSLEFDFDDGDLFAGHSIFVSATIDGGPHDATICG